jgi:serine/threonine protein kinase
VARPTVPLVYLAHDEQLDRRVAIKVPHANLVSQPGDAEAYLTEARTVANLDHSSIVPVLDVGSTADFPCYVVSKYIGGADRHDLSGHWFALKRQPTVAKLTTELTDTSWADPKPSGGYLG